MKVQIRERTIAIKGASEGTTSRVGGGEKKANGGRRSRRDFGRIRSGVHITY